MGDVAMPLQPAAPPSHMMGKPGASLTGEPTLIMASLPPPPATQPAPAPPPGASPGGGPRDPGVGWRGQQGGRARRRRDGDEQHADRQRVNRLPLAPAAPPQHQVQNAKDENDARSAEEAEDWVDSDAVV